MSKGAIFALKKRKSPEINPLEFGEKSLILRMHVVGEVPVAECAPCRHI